MNTAQLPRRLLLSSAICSLALTAGAAWAQPRQAAWPSKPLRLVVGFPAGSSPDLTARTLSEPLSQALGQPVVVENKPGAGGNIGADQVAKATDGHTFGLMINGNMTIAKLLNPAVTYDPLKDLAPVSLLATAPLVLAASTQLPAGAAAVLAAARQGGDKFNYGTPGNGTVAHLGMELLKGKAGIAPVHVPYPGNPQVVTAMVAGDVQLALLPPGLAMPQVRAGKLQAVGVTSAGRSSLVPDVPSLRGPGIAGCRRGSGNGVAAPAGTPPAVINKVSALLVEIVRRPEVREKLFNQGWQVAGTSPQGLANRIQRDTAEMGEVIRRNQIRSQ